jgi:hypothetical protein
MLKKYLAITTILALTGCAVKSDKVGMSGVGGLTYSSNVKTLADGTFYTESEAAPAAGRKAGALEAVQSTAESFCKDKSVKIIKKTTDSHLIINGVAKLTFSCI